MTPMLLFSILEMAFVAMVIAALVIAVVHDVRKARREKKDEGKK